MKKALQLTEEDFLANPTLKKDFVNSYLRLLQSLKPEDWEKSQGLSWMKFPACRTWTIQL